MDRVYVVQIKSGSNNGEFLIKYNKGYHSSKNVGLHNLYHKKDVAEKEVENYIKEILKAEAALKEGAVRFKGSTEYYTMISLRGKTYDIISYKMIKEPECQ